MSTQLHDQYDRSSTRTACGTVVTRCQICARALRCSLAVCYCCQLSARQLGLPLVPTVVTTEYHVGDQAHARLRGYKDGRTTGERLRHRRALVTDLEAWLDVHADEVIGRFGAWSTVTPVPSTHRPGRSPASALLAEVSGLAERQVDLLVRGSRPPGHLDARRKGFAVPPRIDRTSSHGVPVLVFDDSVTTGARSQSAAAALRLAGFAVVGVLAVGRALPARSAVAIESPTLSTDDR